MQMKFNTGRENYNIITISIWNAWFFEGLYSKKGQRWREKSKHSKSNARGKKKELFSQFFSFLKDSKKEWVSPEEQHWSEYFGVMYLSILIPRMCHPKEIKRGMDGRSVVWHYLLQNSSIVMGYPLGKVAWLWLFLIQNILGLFQHMCPTLLLYPGA